MNPRKDPLRCPAGIYYHFCQRLEGPRPLSAAPRPGHGCNACVTRAGGDGIDAPSSYYFIISLARTGVELQTLVLPRGVPRTLTDDTHRPRRPPRRSTYIPEFRSMAPFANPPPAQARSQPPSGSHQRTNSPQTPTSIPTKHLSPDRWFRQFEGLLGTIVTIDVPVIRDEDVVSLSGRLRDLAGKAKGNISLNLSVLDEYTTAWIKALADLSSMCASLGGALNLENMCPVAAKVFSDTKRLHHGTTRRRYADERQSPSRPLTTTTPMRFNIPA